MKERFAKINNVFKGDKVIWCVFFLLCLISVVEVYSASSSLGYKTGNYWWAAFYHTTLLVVGMTATIFVLNVKCKYFKIVTPLLVPLAFILLILVFIIGTKENDAARWLKLFGIIPIQPSEIAKGAMILATAQILAAMQTVEGAAPKAMKYILITSAFLILPIVPENLSTAGLLFGVVIMMMIIGRVPLVQLGKLFSVLLLVACLGVAFIMFVGKTQQEKEQLARESNTELYMVDSENGEQSRVEEAESNEGILMKAVKTVTHRCDTWKGRIVGFFDRTEIPASEYDLDKNGQVGHARIAIASSNMYGRGPGNSVERDFLAQAFSDFIYAIIIEELGIVGAAFVAFLYIILLFRVGTIAKKCTNPFPAYLAMGIAMLMVTQALFNMGVAVGLLPVTGQPLPLISKGGTSSIINCVYIGVILSISRTAQRIDETDIDELDGTAPKVALAR